MKKSTKPKAPWVGMKGAIPLRAPIFWINKPATQKLYLILAEAFKREYPFCMVCLLEEGSMNAKAARDVHHMAGRAGPNLFDIHTWLPVCRQHHDWIAANPKEACQRGYLSPEGWRHLTERRNEQA